MHAATQFIHAIAAAFESIPAALMLWAWASISAFLELIGLVLTGQWTLFVMRVFRWLGSS
jgi:hypothetical protein